MASTWSRSDALLVAAGNLAAGPARRRIAALRPPARPATGPVRDAPALV